MENKTGLLFELCKLLSEKGLSIRAVIGAVTGKECLIRLVTDDNLRAKDTLAEKGYAPEEQDVILMEVPHKPGMLKRIAEVLAGENIDIHYVYSTALDQHEKCLLVLHTANDEHALPRLNETKVA